MDTIKTLSLKIVKLLIAIFYELFYLIITLIFMGVYHISKFLLCYNLANLCVKILEIFYKKYFDLRIFIVNRQQNYYQQ